MIVFEKNLQNIYSELIFMRYELFVDNYSHIVWKKYKNMIGRCCSLRKLSVWLTKLILCDMGISFEAYRYQRSRILPQGSGLSVCLSCAYSSS